MTQVTTSLVERLASPRVPRRSLERTLAQQAIGVIAALREGRMSVDESADELFNLDNYEAVVRRRLSPKVRKMFVWGMELGTVEGLAPDGLDESYDAICRLAMDVLSPKPRRRRVSAVSTRPAGNASPR